MTEADWQASGKPDEMLHFLWQRGSRRSSPSGRKLRLFVCGCCRLAWDLITAPDVRLAVEVAELFADGQASTEQRDADSLPLHIRLHQERRRDATAHLAVLAGVENKHLRGAAVQAASLVRLRATAALESAPRPRPRGKWKRCKAEQRALICNLVREIFGNPFRATAPIPPEVLNWSNGTVRRIAVGIYEERAFEDLPILADALEEAGCSDVEIIDHLRGPGPHVRGCFALDRVLDLQ